MSRNCPRCSKAVYDAEEVKSRGRSYHNTCFKCLKCNTGLQQGKEVDGGSPPEIYCASCHGGLFGPSGFRAGVAGGATGEADATSLDADVKAKLDAKYSKDEENQVRAWIQKVTGKEIGEDFQEGLKDGVLLCDLLNTLRPGSAKGAKPSKMGPVQKENISIFLKGLAVYGFKPQDTFMSVDLNEGKNMVSVLNTLMLLKRKVGDSTSS